jgi:putative oxidoreductase
MKTMKALRFEKYGPPSMVVGTITVQLQNGLFMNWTGQQAGEGFEFDVLATALALIVILYGGGAWSLDRWFTRRVRASV